MNRLGIATLLRTTVREISSDQIVLDDGQVLPSATVIWCAGIAPNPLIRKLRLPVNRDGYVLCDGDLRVQGLENVWAIGDSAMNVDRRGVPYPATAQDAVQQGVHLGKNLESVLAGNTATPLDYKSMGSIAAIGCRTGVAKLLGFKIAGFPAWWLFRTVYLLKMPGLSRKMRLAIDWALDLVFPRDFVQLGVHPSSRTEGASREEDG
jgi:NADH dehydrogenase